jgi:hypothetical protein
MGLNNPRGFIDEVNKAAMNEPSIGLNEVTARRRRMSRGGLGGWGDRVAVLVGVAILASFVGGFLWNLWG